MNKILFFSIISALLLISCNKEKSKEINNEIVYASETDSNGNILTMTFDNKNNTAIFELNNQKIKLKQETTASGIKYSNKDYEYSEWHDEIYLRKNGKIIFSNENTKTKK